MESASLLLLICLPTRLFGDGGVEPLDMLYMLGRCFEPRNLRRSGETIAAGDCFDFDDIDGEDFNVDFEDMEFVLLPLPPPTEEPRRDDGDIISLSS